MKLLWVGLSSQILSISALIFNAPILVYVLNIFSLSIYSFLIMKVIKSKKEENVKQFKDNITNDPVKLLKALQKTDYMDVKFNEKALSKLVSHIKLGSLKFDNEDDNFSPINILNLCLKNQQLEKFTLTSFLLKNNLLNLLNENISESETIILNALEEELNDVSLPVDVLKLVKICKDETYTWVLQQTVNSPHVEVKRYSELLLMDKIMLTFSPMLIENVTSLPTDEYEIFVTLLNDDKENNPVLTVNHIIERLEQSKSL